MTQKTPLKTSFKLKGIIKKVDGELENYEACRKELLNKHGDKNDDGTVKTDEAGNVSFSGNGFKDFVTEMNELNSIDVVVATVTIDELGDAVDLNTQDLIDLDGFVVQ